MDGIKRIKRCKYFMGIDQHKKYSQLTVVDEIGEVVEEKRLLHADKEGMLNYFKSFSPDETKVTLEATGSWYWLVDLLDEANLHNKILAHPYKTRIIADSKIKTDSIDSELLAQLTRGGLIPQSFIAPQEIRSLREELRYRIALVKIRSSLKCRIQSILEREGITTPDITDLFGKKGVIWLKALKLPGALYQTFNGYLSLIENLTTLIEVTNKSIKSKVQESSDAKLLLTIPGVGFFTSYLILCEAVDIHRFLTPNKFASYIGIVPSINQSGNFSHTGQITKQGNKYLRWALIESAQKAIAKDGYLKAFYQKISYKKNKQKAKVAVANKLAHAIWAVLTYKQVYRARQEKIRSGQAR